MHLRPLGHLSAAEDGRGGIGRQAAVRFGVGLLAALLVVPAPAPEEPRPLAASEHPWADRSGALVSAGLEGMASASTSHGAGLGVLRAGMHEYGFEWTVVGGVGTSIETGRLALELAVAPGGRIPLGGRLSLPVRGSAGILSIDADESFALGAEAGIDVAIDRMWRIEAALLCRAAPGFEDAGLVPLVGMTLAVSAIP